MESWTGSFKRDLQAYSTFCDTAVTSACISTLPRGLELKSSSISSSKDHFRVICPERKMQKLIGHSDWPFLCIWDRLTMIVQAGLLNPNSSNLPVKLKLPSSRDSRCTPPHPLTFGFYSKSRSNLLFHFQVYSQDLMKWIKQKVILHCGTGYSFVKCYSKVWFLFRSSCI